MANVPHAGINPKANGQVAFKSGPSTIPTAVNLAHLDKAKVGSSAGVLSKKNPGSK